jgi:hypothetical protein
VTLIGVVVRAAAVALVTATLLLPIADHHAVARLPEVALQLGHPGSDLHSLLVHHHSRPHGRPAAALDRVDGPPLLAPLAPLPVGERGLAPQAAPAPTVALPPVPGGASADAADPIPNSLLEPPPERPPNRPA